MAYIVPFGTAGVVLEMYRPLFSDWAPGFAARPLTGCSGFSAAAAEGKLAAAVPGPAKGYGAHAETLQKPALGSLKVYLNPAYTIVIVIVIAIVII